MSLHFRHEPARSRSRSGASILLRIGNPSTPRKYQEIQLRGPQDARLLAGLVDTHIKANPKTPLLLSINGYQPWLRDVLAAAIYDPTGQTTDLNREVQFASTSRLPEKVYAGGRSTWLTIVDHINVPEVFYWSVNLAAPSPDDNAPLDLEKAKLRLGMWFSGPGGCRSDSSIPTVLIFTRANRVSETIVRELLFWTLYKPGDYMPQSEDHGFCWFYLRLFRLLTDWQNIIRELNGRLAEAEINSHHREFPVKYRTRAMHREMARIHEFKDFLRFHFRSHNKLQKLLSMQMAQTTRKSKGRPVEEEQILDELEAIVDDLSHFEESLDSLKERLNNLLALEFNIQAADQSEGASFLSVVATLFLPLSYLTTLWDIPTSTWQTVWYASAATSVFAASAAFLILYPWIKKQWQKRRYHLDQTRVLLRPQDFTLLGDDLPSDRDPHSYARPVVSRRRSQQLGGTRVSSTH